MKTSQTNLATPWRVRTGALLTGLALCAAPCMPSRPARSR